MRTHSEMGKVILDNQDLFKNTLYKWLIDLVRNKKITMQECIYIYSNIGGIKLRYSDIFNIGLIEPRLKWIKDNLK